MNKYRDAEGNIVSLQTLCRKEPEWAANRILTLMAQVEELIRSNGPRYIYQGSDQEITTINVYRKALSDCVKAMIAWGNEEDGVPVGGIYGDAFDRAQKLLED